MKTILKVFLPLAAIGVAAYFYIGFLEPQAVVVKAAEGSAAHAVPGVMVVLPKVTIDLACEHDGRIVESAMALGNTVEKGQLLLKLDTSELEINLELDRARYDAAVKKSEIRNPREYDLDRARDNLADAEIKRDSLPALHLQNLKNDITRIEEQLRRDKVDLDLSIAELANQVKLLERQIRNMSLYSPIDGVLSEINAYEGDWVLGGHGIARVVSLETIVEVKVSEENFAGLEVGQPARIKFLGYGTEEFTGRVRQIIDVVDADTQRYPLHLEVDIAAGRLYPGLTGDVSITIAERENAIVVPRQAVEGSYVYVVREGVVSVRQIQRGFVSLTSVEILSGLQVGDVVIVENLELFSDGDEVRTKMLAY